MIRSFGNSETERLFHRESVKRIPPNVRRQAMRKLLVLDAVDALDDLRAPPGNRLEKLRGNRAGQHSIRVNDQWRICFRWCNDHCLDVEVVDYH